MKRLRYFFSKMDKNSATYGEMYEGEIKYPPHVPGNDSDFWMTETDPVYWDGELSFAICESSRREKDRPTIKYYIPCEKLKIVNGTYVEADFCYRSLIPLLWGYNEGLRNDKRPDRENGKVYYPEYFGEITVCNTAYFEMRPEKTYINLKENIVQEKPDVQSVLQECLVVMFQVQLPIGKIKKAMQMLCSDIPDLIQEYVESFDTQQLEDAVQLHHQQKEIREWLQQSDYCAFIGNGSILPRKKGNQGPLEGAVPFFANQEDEIEIAGMKGLGIRRGVTVITGGGYSGKSTILDALFAGVYDHVKGDGREY